MRTWTLLLGLSTLSACHDPTLDELEQVVPVPDETVDDTPPDAPFGAGQRRSVGDADAMWTSELESGYVVDVELPGDLDGDGFEDLLLWGWEGADPDIVPCEDGCPSFHRVEVEVFYGGPGFGSESIAPSARLVSVYVNDGRFRVSGAGDVNGDGSADLVISVGTTGCEQGDVYVIYGGERLAGTHDVRDVGAHLREEGSCLSFGHAADVGDLDGDGHGDYVVAAPGNGHAFLYYGTPETPSARRSEENADASFVRDGLVRFGVPEAVGDVDGDGFDDFALRNVAELGGRIGVEHPTERTFFLVRGRAERFEGELAVEALGTRIDAVTLSGIGDVDGDGRDDLAATRNEGTDDAFLIAGREVWPESLDITAAPSFIRRDTPLESQWPARVGAAGDVDGDGHQDFLYGDLSLNASGVVYVFRGPFDLSSSALSLSDGTAFLGLGWELVHDPEIPLSGDDVGQSFGAGDLNGDGLDDIVLGAPGAPGQGRVYIFLGREGA